MSFNGFISVSRAVQITNKSFGEVLREDKWLLLLLQGCFAPRKVFTSWERTFRGGQYTQVSAKGQDQLQILLRGKEETGITSI